MPIVDMKEQFHHPKGPKVTGFNETTTAEEAATALSKNITGKNVIITGPTWGGLGAEAARAIAKYAGLIVLAGRSKEKTDETIENIKKETPSANLRGLVVDFSSLASVREAAAEFNAYPENFHVLINSAAIMASPFSLTKDGFESQIGINHFGPFLFTALTFNKIAAAGTADAPARVVNISSFGHAFSGIRFDDLDFEGGKAYDHWEGYGQSKTANILFSNEIARRAKEKGVPVVAYSLHPGTIGTTGLGKFMRPDDGLVLGATNDKGEWLIELKTAGQGAAGYVAAAFDPSILSQPGAYLDNADISEASRYPHAKSQENGEKLWMLSEAAVKQQFVI